MEVLRLADFVLDLGTRDLTRAAQDLGIGARGAIKKAVWPGSVLVDTSLTMHVANPRPLVGGGL